MSTDSTAAGGRRRYCRYILPAIMLLMIVSVHSLMAQGTNVTVTLTKTVNATSPVPSGQPFTYTLAYSWSGGVPGTITITDPVPPELDVISTLPSSSIVGNTVTFSLTGLTATAGAGTVQINARFKPGVTCNNTRACNTATIQAGQGQTVSSNTVCLTASAQNKWTFEKALVAGCAVDNDVVFRICVINPSGGNIGGLNLTNVQLTDVLPPGAVVTSVSGWWSTFTQTGTTITFGGAANTTLSVSPWNAWYCEYIHVTFPSPTFTQGQTVTNTARLVYKTPCDTVKGGTFSDTANVTLCAANPQGSLWKGLSINIYYPSNPFYYPSFTPGCCGSYTLSYYNSGNVAQPNFVMEDNLPPTLDVSAIRTNVQAAYTPVTLKVYCYSGGSCGAAPCTTLVYNTPGLQTFVPPVGWNVCKVRWEYGQPIVITQSLVNYLDVCVRNASYAPPLTPVTAGQNIINTVTAQATNLPQITATHTKPVDTLRPKILATKLFMGSCGPGCSPLTAGPFVPGNIVRWRMAVANVGNIDALPCTITDLLPSGLTYVGNPTYTYGTVNWGASQYNPPCCSLTVTVPSQIGGSITTPSPGDTNLVWTFPVLPHRCDGTVDYLVIEFDVKIGDTPPMPPGQYNNTFTFSAGNLTTPVTSNVATLTVNAIAQLTLLKEVRPKTPSGTFGAGATVAPGAQVEFRLRLKNTGNLTLTNICLLDILPHIGDITVLPAYIPRNSQFDMPVTAGANVTAPGGYTVGFNNSANSKNPQRTTTCGGFCGVVDPGAGVGVGPVTAGAYGSFSASTYSFTVSGGASTLAPGGTLDIFVTGTVPASAKVGNTACNSMAVQASPLGTTTCLATQSVNACVTVAQPPPNCNGLWLEGHADSCCHYSIILSNALGGIATLQYNVLPVSGGGTPSGLVQGVQTAPCLPTSTVPASLSGTTTGTLNFNPACTGASPLQLGIDATSTSASGEICIELIATIVNPANGEKVTCRDTVCYRCKRAPQTRCDSMSVKPFPFVDLDLSGRTFTLYNLKVPASPICSVKISVTPPPAGPGVNGGGLYIDGVWKSWPFGSSVGYTQILPVHGMPANNTVKFNLGIDYTIGWVGNVNITIYHCDGDSCTAQYGPWKATKKDVILIGTPIDIQERAKLHAYRLVFPRDKAREKNIRAIAIRHSDPLESIVAVTGASFPCDTSENCNDLYEAMRVKQRTILLELRHPLDQGAGGADATLTVLYTSANNQRPSVEIVYYDDAGQEVGHDSTVVTGITIGGVDDPQGITGFLGALNAYPNPTTGRCELGFRLPAAAVVELELFDALGASVATVISRQRMEAGDYHRTVDLGALPNGSYLVTLRVNGVPSVLRVELLR